MPQHDFVLDNGPGLAVRTDMNAALLALVQCSSGPVEPAVMYPGQLWLDTSVPPNGILRQRNLANAAWVAPVLPAPVLPAGIVRADLVQAFSTGEKLQARTNIGAVANSPGDMIFRAGISVPAGFLKCNGALVSRSTYADLFSAISTIWGAGDGSTTFALPDLRGEFIRGYDDARGIDSGRVFASLQTDLVKAHNHDFLTVTAVTGGSTSGIFQRTSSGPSVGAVLYSVNNNSGAENRPRNVALMACIKY
jgi:microcystin-dependent protein